jgi:GxxExxY protein
MQKNNHHKDTKDTKEISNQISNQIVGAAIEVHRVLGPRLLESAYEEALCHELSLRQLQFERQKPMPVRYKGLQLSCGYRLDLLVEDLVVVELKAVDRIQSIFEAQLLTYLKLSGLWLGILLNFNVPVLRNGVRRVVSG